MVLSALAVSITLKWMAASTTSMLAQGGGLGCPFHQGHGLGRVDDEVHMSGCFLQTKCIPVQTNQNTAVKDAILIVKSELWYSPIPH